MITLYRVLEGILFIAGILAIVVLATLAGAAGNTVLGLSVIVSLVVLGLLMGFIGWLVDSRNRRAVERYNRALAGGLRAPRRTVQAEESETYHCDAETLWSLIRSAESAALQPHVKRAFTIPGTPIGVGEQQCFIRADGTVSIIEVLEEDRPYWATTRVITPSDVEAVQTYRIEPSGSVCRLTMGIAVEVPTRWPRLHQRGWRASTRRYLASIQNATAMQPKQ